MLALPLVPFCGCIAMPLALIASDELLSRAFGIAPAVVTAHGLDLLWAITILASIAAIGSAVILWLARRSRPRQFARLLNLAKRGQGIDAESELGAFWSGHLPVLFSSRRPTFEDLRQIEDAIGRRLPRFWVFGEEALSWAISGRSNPMVLIPSKMARRHIERPEWVFVRIVIALAAIVLGQTVDVALRPANYQSPLAMPVPLRFFIAAALSVCGSFAWTWVRQMLAKSSERPGLVSTPFESRISMDRIDPDHAAVFIFPQRTKRGSYLVWHVCFDSVPWSYYCLDAQTFRTSWDDILQKMAADFARRG